MGRSPEEAIVAKAGSDEKKAELAESLPSLCLKQVFPKYMKQFNYLRILERITDIFLRFLGVKGNMKLGPTSFRTFIRQDGSILLHGMEGIKHDGDNSGARQPEAN